MVNPKLIQQWQKDEKAYFKGWDFSYLRRKIIEQSPPWNYIKIAKKLVKKSNAVLDTATGGGEVFSDILSSLNHKKAVAIEGYKPNVAIARRNLKKYDAKVIYANETKRLPFKDKEFDLVLNRHGGLNIKEFGRVTSPGGIFLTQQVDGGNLIDLMKEFGVKPKWKFNTLSNVKKNLKDSQFKIVKSDDWTGKIIFNDVGALVYFLKAVPWTVNNFSVKRHLPILEKLQKRLDKSKRLEFRISRFMILAKKI